MEKDVFKVTDLQKQTAHENLIDYVNYQSWQRRKS